MKINPDSTILGQLDGEWQKMAMLLLWKLAGRDVVRITVEDMIRLRESFEPGIPVILTHGHSDSIEFSLVTEADAERLAAHDSAMRGTA